MKVAVRFNCAANNTSYVGFISYAFAHSASLLAGAIEKPLPVMELHHAIDRNGKANQTVRINYVLLLSTCFLLLYLPHKVPHMSKQCYNVLPSKTKQFLLTYMRVHPSQISSPRPTRPTTSKARYGASTYGPLLVTLTSALS